MDLTKSAVRSALGFTKDIQLAEFFGVGKAAVSNWPEDELLPEARQWQARAKRPDLFPPEDAGRHRSPAASAGATAEATPTVLTGKVA
ncbi:DNA-binding transcriptional regulator Cro [Luteibacter sp. UNC138MFCol5.1]|uniref:helix-turn-helix domain-containing protein n=1 Tax=Luteibacter sp. UNC138MFCol5.1 TaxID=1502774 RepID=UPI0008D7C803|nr:helix-turn-helix domain-containing protein [Luteibacter sp. UNC138MFCol5.1]SEO63958.1 DNA-binding transcriptional regulator Cro [Luteibacter sp. UNC138MFCol5.1]